MHGTSLAYPDIIVIAVYLAIVVGKGALLSRKQHSVEDYFLAGRSMSFWVVSISIIASLLSAITYMGAPTEAYSYDLKFSLMLLGIVAVTPIVLHVFLPFFYKLKLYTAYEYLEVRFSTPVRVIASTFFIFWRLGWMALVIFAPSLAISTFFGIDWRVCAVLVGVASTAYTVMGGMTAVIWTDVIQFFVLYGGAILIIVVAILRTDGGLGYIWSTASAAGKLTTFDWTWDPFKRITTWAILLGGCVGTLAAYSTDQVAIQRYLTTKSYRECRRSLIFHAIIIVPVSIVFYWMGTALWAFYQQQPELLAGFDAAHPDRIVPFFIAGQLPVGVRGVLIAAIFAATMSSVDSGINSITTTTIVDYCGGLFKRQYSQEAHLRLARIWTVIWGVIVTGCAIVAGTFGQTLLEMSNKVSGLFCGPLLGIFLLGMLTRRANWQGALIGAAIGFAATLGTAFGTPISHIIGVPLHSIGFLPSLQGALYDTFARLGKVTFLYYPTIGCGLTFGCGLLFSHVFDPPRPDQIAPVEELASAREQAAAIPDQPPSSLEAEREGGLA